MEHQISHQNCVTLFLITQLVNVPTHNHGNMLDLILTNMPENILNLETDKQLSSFSDHFFISFVLQLRFLSNKTNKPRCLFNYKKTDLELLSFEISNLVIDPDVLINPNTLWLNIKDSITRARNISTPTFKASSEQHPRWFTPEIDHLQKKLKTLNKLIKRNPTSTRLSKLATLETTLEAMCREAKSEYEISIIKSFSSQPKKQLNRLKSTKSLPLYLQADGTQVFDNTVKANIMNKFFNSTFSNSRFKLPPISELPTPSSQLREISFDSLGVYEVLCKLDATKAMGIDNLHPH